MKLSGYFTASLAFILFEVTGCGPKPLKIAQEDINISNVLRIIENNTLEIRDFDGAAKIEAELGDIGESTAAKVRYIYPSDFRVYLKGFAGIEIARLNSVGDSITIYLPTENLYIREPKDAGIPQNFLPGFDIGSGMLKTFFTGEVPGSDIWDEFYISLKQYDAYVELTMQKDGLVHRYVLSGEKLRVKEEEKWLNGNLLWRREISGYRTFNGGVFPEKITFEKDGNVLTISFIDGRVNSGLTYKDLLMTVPSSAERIQIEQNAR